MIHTHSPMRRFHRNLLGRDFVVGDIHGAYSLVDAALVRVGFRPGADRLFCVGDLADRGSRSARVGAFLRWLDQGNGASVRGNHEDMLVDLYDGGPPSRTSEFRTLSSNGMDWLLTLDTGARMALASIFATLPLAIEIETEFGIVGVVHADVPADTGWDRFVSALGSNDARAQSCAKECAIWSRNRIARSDTSPIEGVAAVFVGHTIVASPRTLGNTHFIDTGAFLGETGAGDGYLTLVEITRSALQTIALAPPPVNSILALQHPG